MASHAGEIATAPPRRSGALEPPAVSAEPAGAAGLHRHPDPVLHRDLVLAAALQARSAVHARLHLVRELPDLPDRPGFWNTVQVSLLYAALTVGLELLLGLGIALLLQRSTLLNNVLIVLLMLPLMIAPAIAALMWKLMTNPNFGIMSYLVGLVGLSDFKWASDPRTALLTVVLVDIWVYTPFIMVLLLAGLRALPRQPFEAAELDGVPATFVFFRITLPMLTPYIITASLFRMLDSIQQFDIIYAMTQGGPGDTLMVFQVDVVPGLLPVRPTSAARRHF